jgi:hypothetical protein
MRIFFPLWAILTALSPADAQQQPAIRQIGPVISASAEPFGQRAFVRHVKAGVLVNDVEQRRLVLLDTVLGLASVVADTTPGTANAYSGRVGSLIAYHADSSLFVDPQSMSMLVIDPAGKVTRVMSVPRSQDAMVLGNPMLGTPGFDASGKLVYRGMPRPMMRGGPGGAGGGGGRGGAAGSAGMHLPDPPDSIALVRVDLASRQVDTLTFTKIPKAKVDVQRDDNGRVSVNVQMNPLPVVDDWAVTSDGSVAIVRGRDYHVDWIRPDGSRESSPKMPFAWQRMTDDDKAAFIDSLKAARERMAASNPSSTGGNLPVIGAPAGDGGGGQTRVMVMGPGAAGAAGAPGAAMPNNMNFLSASELPDYKPAFFAGSTRADADGNLWIRTIPTKAIAGGPVYDVVNSKGELVERVQVPKNRTIVGFGPGGIVYLLAREEGAANSTLEKARTR